ncbi:MAG: rod shape-determining protein MreC [Candidatus Kapaibacterium sp.]|jgi:rod shape-determining protein MreC|nr:rod shape-determining protein MreC [Candidatus Kapabacteria bacterium]
MYRLIELVVRFKEIVSLCALIVICFSLMSWTHTGQLGGFRAVIVGGIGWMQSAFAWIPNPVSMKSENAALRELNLQLSEERASIRQALIENATLRKMLEFKKQSPYQVISADIVGKTTTEVRNFVTINKGEADSIKEGMPVITDAGLIGTIIGTSSGFSIAQLLINRDSRIAAKILRSRIDGIVTWEGEQDLVMKNIPKSYDVKVGDEVVTSEYSNRYPNNIRIGWVSKTIDEPTSLFRRILVKPSANFSTLEQVYVAKVIPNPERLNLEREIEARLRERRRIR